jgi:ribosomal protein S27E
MKNEKPQYKPYDKRSDLNDLVCPNCGNEVDSKYYNEITKLIKCPECKHVFVFDDSHTTTAETSETILKENTANQLGPGTLYLVAFILLIVALLILSFVN